MIGNAEDAENDQRGQLPCKIANEIRAAAREALAEESCREFANEGLHHRDATRGESEICQAPDPGVSRRISIGEHRIRVEAAIAQNGLRRRTDRLDWRESIRCREHA